MCSIVEIPQLVFVIDIPSNIYILGDTKLSIILADKEKDRFTT